MRPAVWLQLIQDVTKDPRKTFKEPQVLLTSVKISCHDSTIWQSPDRIGGTVRWKPLFTQKNIKVCINSDATHLDNPQTYNLLQCSTKCTGSQRSCYIWAKRASLQSSKLFRGQCDLNMSSSVYKFVVEAQAQLGYTARQRPHKNKHKYRDMISLDLK